MPINIRTFIVGPIDNNVYLISDPISKAAALIDPSAPSREIIDFIERNGLQLAQIWITHAHFDHIGGVRWFLKMLNRKVETFIHQDAVSLWKDGGSARDFGFDFDPGPVPQNILHDADILSIGNYSFEVLHTPGHSHGHVTYYCASESAAFCGDLIFYHGVGRTDLAVSNEPALYKSIQEKIFSLPDQTKLYPGHGRYTTVGEEKENNPFI